jgi:hypothetical protein
MSWLLFLDESGHDHKHMPYEVRGGVALHAKEIWPFVRAVDDLEYATFGARLADYNKEFKGSTLVDKKRISWAKRRPWMDEAEQRKFAKRFLDRGANKEQPNDDEFVGYGQACYRMAEGVFRLLREHHAHLFASVIPKGAKKPKDFAFDHYLRTDLVYLLERYYYFLRDRHEHGLLVLDRVEETDDRRFISRLEAYFSKTTNGSIRAEWIVPSPLFVSSVLSIPVQAADLCIYCLNWGYRTVRDMNAEVRQEIADSFAPWIERLCWKARLPGVEKRSLYGIVYVDDPYKLRK